MELHTQLEASRARLLLEKQLAYATPTYAHFQGRSPSPVHAGRGNRGGLDAVRTFKHETL